MELDVERMLLRLIGRVEELEERVRTLEKQLSVQENDGDSEHCGMPEKIVTNSDVRTAMRLLSAQGMLSERDVHFLLDPKWCTLHLRLNFPLLKRADEGRYDEKGYPRYWSNTISLYGCEYFICSQWYPHNRGYFEKWLSLKLKNGR